MACRKNATVVRAAEKMRGAAFSMHSYHDVRRLTTEVSPSAQRSSNVSTERISAALFRQTVALVLLQPLHPLLSRPPHGSPGTHERLQ